MYDPDTSANTLVINILDAGPGHFELNHKPSVAISSFTRQDVDNHDVAYVHHPNAANESYITLQVSDGIETSAAGKLRISAFPQFWRLQNNTGLILMHSTSSIITPYNLSFVSNVANAIDSAQYQIEQGPQFGVIEVEKDVGRWENTVIFSSDDLRQRRVRYRHITSRPDFDEFQFRTTLNLSMLYTFRMSFAKCRLFAINLNLLSLNERDEGALTVDHLRFQTDPVSSPTTSIVYHVVDPPKHGYLFYSVSKYHLRKQDVFTQEDVLMSNVKYKLYRKSYSLIVDSITVDIVAPGCRNVTETLHIRHVPSNETMAKVEAVLGHLTVEEGGVTSINNQTLNIRTEFTTTDLLFNITSPPIHGVIQVIKGTSIRNSTDYFTKDELINNQVFYQHDDSESERDSFIFMVLSNKKEDFEYVNILNIVISLKNDNSLVRVIDKMFHVVVAGERLLTGDDLSYSDVDIDTKMMNIVYTFRDLPNGEFYDARNPNVNLSEFSQKDLNERSVLFKHKGPEFGKIKFSVTDGAYYVFGILEVQASAPFIRAVMSKRFAIQHGKCAVVTSEHLNFDTNLYASDDDVQYEVTTKPSFGKLIYTDSSKIVNKFTQTDVNNGLISYQNDVTTSSADEIGLKIRCRDAINVANFGTWMLPASYWEPLKVKTSRILYVEESTSAIIGKNTLEIFQPEVPPSSIIYHITELPENGYISILPANQNGDDQSTNVRSFSQSLTNENRIIYIQSVSNETMDKVTFNVTNGMVWLSDLTLHIQIIPERLYLGSHLLTVNEGGVAVISTLNLFIVTEYFKTRVSDYVILEEPKHGCIQIQRKCNKLHGFSHKEFAAGIVFYSHDGSENLEDSILLVGVAGEKRSIPVLLNITVLPVNDQKPKLVNNTGLIMWEGGTAVITKEMLGAFDADKPKDSLVYHLRSAWWGNITLATNRNIGLRNFTQDMIDKHQIVFRHKNGSEAKFVFNVSDGLHFTDDHTFHIKTKPVKLTFTHKPLHIFPSQPKYLTSVHLLSKVSDPEREIYYEVVTPPSLGHLMMKSDKGTFNIVNGFTQNDLNESRVIYKHVHPFSGLYANDSFVFNVKSHLAETLFNRKMKIEISVSSGGLDAYVSIPKIIVDEGGMTKIVLNFSGVVVFLEDHAGLRSPVIHASVVHPHHGQIFLQNQSNLSTFTQQQLESGQVHYQHDHSDSLGDNIYFSLYLIPGYIMLCNITVPVIINPINDQPFRLVTQAPHLTVVQGESRTISKVELCTEDLDTIPAELIYDTVSGPHEGKVVLLPDMIAITQFTQADVDDNKLIYIHNSSVLTDTIHIRVWDGRFRPEYFVFNIKVLPIDLNVTGGLPVYIQQGMNVVHLRNQQFHVETNINRKRIQYVIRDNPKHGLLYVKDRKSNRFNQENLDENEVMYMQRDMTTANDSFRVFVGIFHGNTSSGGDVDIHVKVQPLMQMGNCTVLAGEINKLSLHILDATPLAKLTSSNPKYTIVNPPKNGKIKKIIRSSGEHRNVLDTVVTTFTHEEVQSGLIYIAVKDMEVGWSGVADSLQFVLAATIFQPAVAELKITIKSSLHNDIYSTLAGPNDPAGHEGGMHFASPNMTRDYFLIVSMVAGVIILGVAVIIVIKCRSFDPEEINKEEQCLQPIPLPRPPDRLMTSSPPLLKQSDGYVSPIPATLPHCKVTPLSRNELDTNARYPYGVDEQHIDDWSSCDASDPACASRNNIMLRRNQYWV